MSKDRIEHCHFCDLPTGKAGASEDSIYISWDDGEIGPLCDACWDGIRAYVLDDDGTVSALRSQRDAAVAALRLHHDAAILAIAAEALRCHATAPRSQAYDGYLGVIADKLAEKHEAACKAIEPAEEK